MSDYLDKIRTQKKDGTPIATVPLQDTELREDYYNSIQFISNPLGNIFGFVENMAETDPAKRITYTGANRDYSPLTVDLSSTHLATYNDWADYPILTENKPCMVKVNGVKDYELDPTDYSKKANGDSSDVTNTSYNGGAYSWLPKIYKRTKIEGNLRYVDFSMEERPGFIAQGFKDETGRELPGLWIPMFYGTEVTINGKTMLKSLATGGPQQSKTTAQQKEYIDNLSSRARFYGGPVIDTIADLLCMFSKNSDAQAVFGYGNMSGGNGAQYMINNAITNPGQFYGSTDGKSINRAFHSMLLLTQNQWQRDPYTLNINGKFYVSDDYHYDITGASYIDTGITVTPPSSNSWVYPHQMDQVDGFGGIFKAPYSAGGNTNGYGCGMYLRADQLTSGTRVALRFASCNSGRNGGPRCLHLDTDASNTYWYVGASALLLPPSEPASEAEIILPDDSRDDLYKLGVNNGLLYIETI